MLIIKVIIIPNNKKIYKQKILKNIYFYLKLYREYYYLFELFLPICFLLISLIVGEVEDVRIFFSF